jgi:hypothetical protein
MSESNISPIYSTKIGVNGESVYTEDGVGDFRVSLFTMLNRDLSYNYINEYVKKIIKKGDNREIEDLFVITFQTRDIRGGKGEKKLFYKLVDILYKYEPIIMINMLELIPEYGCWRDFWEICERVPLLEPDIMKIVTKQFRKDIFNYNNGMTISLLAKWLPREKSGRYPKLPSVIAKYIYSNETSTKKCLTLYRKQISALNRALKTAEVNMCSHTWSDIVPENVPGRCLKMHTRAFLNENIYGDCTSLRYEQSADRMKCRENFQAFIEDIKNGNKVAKGADVIMPHEIVKKSLVHSTTPDEHSILQSQWEEIVKETLTNGGLNRCIPMCDFSGSMNGLPILISLALGILISEINHESFRDSILTFDARPSWHSFKGLTTLKKKLYSIYNNIFELGQGLNTDFYKACICILNRMIENRTPVSEEPESLIVLTDMGWDKAHNTTDEWKTQIDRIREEFQIAGQRVWGEGNGWKAPQIVIWNLSAKYNDFHAKATDEGVVILSGWSPSILKSIQGNGILSQTPYDGMRTILDDPRYDLVRTIYRS